MKISLKDCHKSLKNDDIADSLKTTGNSIAFKTIGRQKKANWSNRFVKDFYDLEYETTQNLNNKTKTSKKNQDWNSKKRRKSCPQPQYKRFTEQIKLKDIKLDQYISKVDYLTPKNVPKQKIIIPKDQYDTFDTKGLCRFQFKKTIHGKMKYKSNHHYAFGNQTQRSSNYHHVWYNPKQNLQIKTNSPKKIRQKIHSFTSYTNRKVFEPRDELDKIYEIQPCLPKAYCTFLQKKLVDMDKITGMTDSPPKITTQLAYNTLNCFSMIKQSPKIYTICKSQRQLQFSRQIISPERGCYR